jgi:cyclic beta-1,2-glucan synthetase
MIPFLEGRILKPDESDDFSVPKSSSQSASLFEHCALALDKSLAVGAHGLPLIGGGDWNDGMNAVGRGGKGESVWLAWFLHATLSTFADLTQNPDQSHRVSIWRQHAESLRQALDRDAWDGDWYRRAFFDDGTSLGSVENSECRIDSIAQSWAVISGAADPARSVRAMAALDKYLINRDAKLSLLFTPPFNVPARDPGYIKGYPPGIRENGGQYTHGAIWAVLAYATLGDGDKAGELVSMLNPILHSDNPAAMQRYKVEPYVVCADVYSEPPHVGRGGWTWYTGSAGWLYRVTLESMLGFHLHANKLELNPCIPRSWRSFEVNFRYHSTRYEIIIQNPDGVCRGIQAITLDGQGLAESTNAEIPLIDDGKIHQVVAVMRTQGR